MTKSTELQTDLLRFLENLKRMFETSLDTVTCLGRNSLQLAMAIEARFLVAKLSQTVERLPYHPPFLEFSDVDFNYWADQFSHWQVYMQGTALENELVDYERFTPSYNFFVDFYDSFVANGPDQRYYDTMGVEEYLRGGAIARGELDENRANFMHDFEQKAVHAINQDQQNTPGFLLQDQSEAVKALCCHQFEELSKLLYRIDAILRSDFSGSAYANLYDRTALQRAKSMIGKAYHEVSEWRDRQRPDKLIDKALVQIELNKDKLSLNSQFHPLVERLNFEKPLSLQHAEIGRYLFYHHKELSASMASLLDLVYRITVIEQYQKIAEQDVEDDATIALMKNPLPGCFTEKLRSNPAATRKFIERLRQLRPYINTGKQESSGDPRWGHLYNAFESDKLQITDKNVPPLNFGKAMALQFPGEKEESIASCLQPNRFSTKGDGQIIINNLIVYFSQIWDNKDNPNAGTSISWPIKHEIKKNIVKI